MYRCLSNSSNQHKAYNSMYALVVKHVGVFWCVFWHALRRLLTYPFHLRDGTCVALASKFYGEEN